MEYADSTNFGDSAIWFIGVHIRIMITFAD